MTCPDILGREPIEAWYIAGPMRGHERFNFPVFDRARDLLRRLGHVAISPADHDRAIYPNITAWAGYPSGDIDLCPEFDYHAAMTWDLSVILSPLTTGVALLPGWETSSGATLERHVAEAAGKSVRYIDPDYGWGYFGEHPHLRVVA